jgi:predicted GNAT superfamily acetyltransferase
MLAVTHGARGLGLGKKLKLFQRDALLELGIPVVYWTYDPLVARNANLNINGLGARPVEYVCDMYGDDTGSDLHSALGTDRFIAEWRIDSEQVAAAIEGRSEKASLPTAPELLANSSWQTGEVREADFDPSLGQCWVEVPESIERIKHHDRAEAMAWRAATRGALVAGLERGFVIDGFAIGDPAGGDARRSFYRLSREP